MFQIAIVPKAVSLNVIHIPFCEEFFSNIGSAACYAFFLTVLLTICSKLLIASGYSCQHAADFDAPGIKSPADAIDEVLTKVTAPPNAQCSQCSSAFLRPVRLDCGHIFCDKCIRGVLSWADQCPTCHQIAFKARTKKDSLYTQWTRNQQRLLTEICTNGFLSSLMTALAQTIKLSFRFEDATDICFGSSKAVKLSGIVLGTLAVGALTVLYMANLFFGKVKRFQISEFKSMIPVVIYVLIVFGPGLVTISTSLGLRGELW